MDVSERAATTETRVGEVLAGRYQLEAVLAQGGMGTVFRGRQVSLNRPVAVKLLHPSLEREQSRRFLQEAHIVAQLDHPNCVAIHDFGRTDDGRSFIAMQLLNGHSLSLETGQRHDPNRAAEIVSDLLRGLEHAHARGVIHRDLKPENLYLAREADGRETVKIVDFGIAKHNEGGEDDGTVTVSGLMSGTPAYMSPEQAIGIDSDGRTDIYSAGMILFELLAGQCAFEDDDAINLLQMHMTEPLPALPDDVPPELVAIVKKMCAKERKDRYQSATAALTDLDAFLGIGRTSSDSLAPTPIVEPKPADVRARSERVTRDDLDAVALTPQPALQPRAQRSSGVYFAGVGLVALLFGGWFTLRPAAEPEAAPAEPKVEAAAAPRVEPAAEPVLPVDADGGPDLVALLAIANNRSEPQSYVERHAALEQLTDSEMAERIDRRLQIGLDAVQADEAESPCATFGTAMAEMRRDPHEDFHSFATAARVPVVDGESCPGGDSQLQATREALGLATPEAEDNTVVASRKRSKSRSQNKRGAAPAPTPEATPEPIKPPAKPAKATKPAKPTQASTIPKLEDDLRELGG